MKCVTAETMRDIDRRTIEEYGIPGVVLMENAGRALAAVTYSVAKERGRRKVLVLVGPGNNGGDGLVAARYLARRGLEVLVHLCVPSDRVQGDAVSNLRIAQALHLPFVDLATAKRCIASGDYVVLDALLGTGAQPPVRPPLDQVLRALQGTAVPIVAADLPSGLCADSGRVDDLTPQAVATVTFGLPKVGLFLYPGAERAGRIVVAEIGLPPNLLSMAPGPEAIDLDFAASLYPERSADTHKGTYGHVLVVGGAAGMSGALCLAAEAALRAGAGLVTAAAPASQQPIAAVKLNEVMTRALPEEKGHFTPEAAEAVLQEKERYSVLAVGPGFGRQGSSAAALSRLLVGWEGPAVIDADALTLLAALRPSTAGRGSGDGYYCWVLTPHPGEMARLLHCPVADVQNDRLGAALEASRRYHAVAVLKGAHTIVAAPDGRLWINLTGNPGMATGGSGDVLTGVIAALRSQGLEGVSAACLGVCLHGLAGDLAALDLSQAALTAGDLIAFLPPAQRVVGGAKKGEFPGLYPGQPVYLRAVDAVEL